MSTIQGLSRQVRPNSHHDSRVVHEHQVDLGTRWRRDDADKRFQGRPLPDRKQLLDQALERIHAFANDSNQLHQILDEMISELREVRMGTMPQEWANWVLDTRKHPILKLIHEDPFTRRAFEKPRGYAGDATMLDYIYGREEFWLAPQATELGSQLFEYTTRSPAPEGVRSRRAYLAKVLDRLADEIPRPYVLSLAAGHFREALLSSAVKRKRFGRVIALDSDAESLSEVDRCYSCFGVETMHASVRQLLGRKHQLGNFDLIYSTGLFDYLNHKSSRRLVTNMFNMLNSGGRIIVANFLPGIRDVGYMEIFMDWNLIYRTRQEMMDMTAEIPQEEIQDIRVFAEENQNIIFLEITRGVQSRISPLLAEPVASINCVPSELG